MTADRAGSEQELPPQLARLPPGRHGLPREFVATNHRDRLIAACSQQVQEHGYTDTTVATIIKAAAVSRRTFYEHFDSKEACFLATYDLLMGYVQTQVLEAFAGEGEWPDQVRAALAAMLGFLASEPDLARLCMVEPLIAGPPIADHHRDSIGGFSHLIEAGRTPDGPQPPPDTGGAVAAGIGLLITRRVTTGQAESLPELLPDLLESALAPFLGTAEATRIAQQPTP